MNVLNELKPFYSEILNMMPDEFDSHQFILMLAHKHQSEYVGALYACQDVRQWQTWLNPPPADLSVAHRS
jgi:hypothetical protein